MGLMLARYRSLARDERGFTLIEVLVVIAMIGILTGVTISLIIALFDSNIRAGEYLDQQTTIETMYGFMASRLATAQRPVALTKGSGNSQTVDPLSISGDQLVWESPDGLCYRVFYVKRLDQIRATVATTCTDPKVKPVRGPNQKAANGTDVAQPTDPDYDIALDKPLGQEDSSFILASSVSRVPPANAPQGATNPLVFLTPLGDDNLPLAVDDEASNSSNPNNHSDWYDSAANREDVASFDVTAYVDPSVGEGAPRVPSRYYRQNISLQQVCNVPGAGTTGATPGSVVEHLRVDGDPSGGWQTLAANAGGYDILATNGSGDPLQSGQITSQNVWLNFNGAVTVRNVTGSFEIKAELMKADTGDPDFSAVADKNGRSKFIYSSGVSYSAAQTVPFAGNFQLPGAGAQADTQYIVRISIGKHSNSLDYTTKIDSEFLDYQAIAY
jgi:prepilin-type N-terminal cleavage/methylation domain-containing protein